MNDRSDQELLRDYAENRSESAFGEIVRRHVDFVHSAATRMTCDAELARDVTQGVFVALANSAHEMQKHPAVPAWLHRAARNLAVKAIRSDSRRRAREKTSAAMNHLDNSEDDVWAEVAPHLDQALDELADLDRHALILRYFERKSAREIAQALGTTEEAAQKRVARAIDRLRDLIVRHSVTVEAGALGVLITVGAVQSAPASLAGSISAAVCANSLAGAAVTATTAKIITMTALQKAVISLALAAVTGTAIYQARRASISHSEVAALRNERAPLNRRIAELTRNLDSNSQLLISLREENERIKKDTTELLKLRGELAKSKRETQELANLKNLLVADQTLSSATSWKDRVNRLKQRLDEDPKARIPEFQLLTEKDWLNAARGDLETETDYRRAFSTLRNAAENKLAPMLKKALKQYMAGNNQQVPTEISQLLAYFDKPVDGTMLNRWEIAPADRVKSLRMGGDVIITQKSPVDEVFDSRVGIGPNGFGQTDFLSTEIGPIMDPVWKAYRDAHNGEWPEDASQLQAFAETPQQQAALEKLMLKNSGGD